MQAQFIQKFLKDMGPKRKRPGISEKINFYENKRAKALIGRSKYIDKQGFLSREKLILKENTIDREIYSGNCQKI